MRLMIELIGRDVQYLFLVTTLSNLFETEPINNNGETVNGWIANTGGWVCIYCSLSKIKNPSVCFGIRCIFNCTCLVLVFCKCVIIVFFLI